VVRLDGKPLAGAVVVFLPIDDRGTLTQGETDENGRYELFYASFPGGTAPGDYKVAISYLATPDGTPQGLGPRSALAPPPGFHEARELLPKKYSDLGQTELKRTVGETGGTFDFDLEGPLLPFPTAADAPAVSPPPSGSEASGDTPTERPPT
jgi:hypothetical protein